MSAPRPKILTRVTIPTGGWLFRIKISDTGSLDTTVNATLDAGDYYVSGDGQSDDLLHELDSKMGAAITTALAGFATGGLTGFITTIIEPDAITTFPKHHARIFFDGTAFVDATGDNDVEIVWSECATGLVKALGSDGNDQTSTLNDIPNFRQPYQHGYGWYATEDGQLLAYRPEDGNRARSVQGVSLDGTVKTQFFGDAFMNQIGLQFLPRELNSDTLALSDGKGYGDTEVYPYNRNQPLECWWYEARQGIPFRVYRNANIDTARAEDRGTMTAGTNSTTIEDTAKSWTVNQWVGKIVRAASTKPDVQGNLKAIPRYVVSNTATALTVNAHPSSVDFNAYNSSYHLYEHAYKTYVLDTGRMDAWEPQEIPRIDRYNVSIPLKKLV